MIQTFEPGSPQRRARSASPSKAHRRDLYHHATQSLHSFDDLICSNGQTFDRSELKKLVKSPLSKKLHVATGPHNNPIPFQLQLPPRLSKSVPNSPDGKKAKKAPTRMIFNGQKYEPYYSDDLNLDGDESLTFSSPVFEQPKARLQSPEKPPSLGNRKKIAKFAEKNNVHLLHQLSIIREKSMRKISLSPTKELPPCPVFDEPILSKRISSDSFSPSHEARDATMPTSRSQPLLAPIAKSLKPVNTKLPLSSETSSQLNFLSATPEHSKINMVPNEAKKYGIDSEEQDHPIQPLRLPNSNAIHHMLYMGESSQFKIDKRTFSDESTVSSVSSFSSIGDAFIKTCASMSRSITAVSGRSMPVNLIAIDQSKRAPISNEMELEPPAPQEKSIESTLSINDHSLSKADTPEENIPRALSEDTIPLVDSRELAQKELPSLVMSDTQLTSNTTTKESEKNLPNSPLGSNNETANSGTDENLEKSTSVDDNIGLGMGFNFPNDELNLTNDKEAKSRSQKNRGTRRKSVLGHMTPQGQIEIPKLLEESPLKHKSSPALYNSHFLRDIFKSAANDSTDSDSESSFNSQFSNLQAKQFKKTHIPFSKSMGAIATPIASGSSPIRHTRQKSMFNINIADLDFEEPPLNTRSNRHLDLGAGLNPNDDFSFPLVKKSVKSVTENGKSQENDNDASILEMGAKMTVNEPPQKVEYAVDFKTASPAPLTSPKLQYKVSYSDRLQQIARSTLSHPSYYNNQPASETNSSYKSSRTGHETASTAASEVESVTIDLTKEKYDVCLVQRQDSTLLYKSVIENTRDGQKVEVVLVDDEEETDNGRDDLLSIYSTYIGGWNKSSSVKSNNLIRTPRSPMQRQRRNSVLSTASEESDCSENSWAAGSTSNFQVKTFIPRVPLNNQQNPVAVKNRLPQVARKGIPPRRKHPESPEWQDIEEENPINLISKLSIRDDGSYFDYTQGGRYDFNSYMMQNNKGKYTA